MTIFSGNCVRYYDVTRVAVHGEASVKGVDDESCSVSIPTINSCQRVRMEAPDEITDKRAREEVVKEMKMKGCSRIPEDMSELVMNYRMTQYSNAEREYSPEELLETGNVGNCSKVANNLNDVTHQVTAECYTFGEVTMIKNAKGEDVNIKGVSGRLKASARLGICDVREDAMPQAMEDLRNLAAHTLKKRETLAYDVAPQTLECTFSMQPR
tara:strand:+ start:59 stop:694 length:636 start_codon:yes stop_codon:yes gene_type:complete